MFQDQSITSRSPGDGREQTNDASLCFCTEDEIKESFNCNEEYCKIKGRNLVFNDDSRADKPNKTTWKSLAKANQVRNLMKQKFFRYDFIIS